LWISARAEIQNRFRERLMNRPRLTLSFWRAVRLLGDS
jgi:hypothetical protein